MLKWYQLDHFHPASWLHTRRKNVELVAQLLIKHVSLDVVQAALELTNGTSAPGIDGVQVSIYKMFLGFFDPIMLNLYNHILKSHS